MKNIIGNPARGEDFFPRKTEIHRIGKRIEAGGHIQLTAPRRVGKTSILMFFRDNPLAGYHFVYVDTEGVEEPDQYFKRLLEEILKISAISQSVRILKQFETGTNKFLGRVKTVKALGTQIELNEAAETDHYTELLNFIKGIDLAGEKIVVLNDEFPYTIENIIDKHNGDTTAAESFLKLKRTLRTDPEIDGKLQLVYTGSIGLNALVERMGKTELMNDVNAVNVNPLTDDEARQLTSQVLATYGYTIDYNTTTYLLKKADWLIPFHIQLALQEIMDLVLPGGLISDAIIDKAFAQIVDYKNNSYFDHYLSRLRKQFKNEKFEFAVELLSHIASNGTLHTNAIHNMAQKHGVQHELKSLLGTLAYDGYINNNDQPDTYRFNSPIIKMWWQKYVSK
jgi:hypothetical protein